MTRDGRQISVEFTIILLRDSAGQMTGIAAIMRDITPRFEEIRRLRRQVAALTPAPAPAAG
jgi:PAS domain S-box-containing protein